MKIPGTLLAVLVLSVKDFKIAGAAITANGCGTTKTCLRYPENCNLTDSGCRFFSWAPGAQNGTYTFEMTGGTGSAQYIAMALARASQMADADLYYCDGAAVRTGALQTLHDPPAYYRMTNGLSEISASIENNIAQCTFTRPSSVLKNISSDAEYNFDITSTKYFLLAAIGPMSGTEIRKHNVWKTKTSSSIDFSAAPTVNQGCGTSKTCFSSPNDCTPGTRGCYFYSWRKTSDSTYEFEIVGGTGSSTHYAAIALGTESKMVNADLYYCDGVTVRSGIIRDAHVEPTYVSTTGLVTSSAKTINGVAYCLFTRPASVTRTISGDKQKNFNMNTEKYFLLAASGAMKGNGQISPHTWKTKTDNKIIGSSSGRLNANQPVLLGLVALMIMKGCRDLTM